MKRIRLFALSKLLPLFLMPVLLYSCQPTAAPGGPRKKMPDLTGDDALEGSMPFQSNTMSAGPESFAFHTSDVDLEVGGIMQGFVYVPLPDASNDSLALALLRSYKIMALPLLNAWAAQQHQGVAIDLSSHNGSPTHRTDYKLGKTGEFSIPVVVIWDNASAYRLTQLKAITAELPGLTFNTTSH